MPLDNDTIKMMLEIIKNEQINNEEKPKKTSKKIEEVPIVEEKPKKTSKKVVEVPIAIIEEKPKKTSKKVEEVPIAIIEEKPKKTSKKVVEVPIAIVEEKPKKTSKKVEDNDSDSDKSNKTDEDKKYKKKPIPSTLKRLVWNKWIGEEIGKYKCLCCNVTDINQMSFNCGHIIAECKGGETILKNLKPICQNCNSSMGTLNMDDFMKSFE